jgi:hypothetical protein
MADHDQIRQPEGVSKPLANYLDMTAPRTRASKRPRRRVEQERATRPPLDNRDFSLEEGNDFA